ncbi:hypothetical protein [Microbacterium allomyrinae]|uniref:Uncharacterized protein n=1 Tax=Microbacterium allomyrinae TaxID=2830666 RepID=A0A9X1LUQ8_9MICO|nr:hypothetical protein [Microbacterium allomyrinae]MCC2032177.1 hypothetical protein [Microbacterium allomyrinae]
MTNDDGLLRTPYRTVRAVRAPEDGPWPGSLVRTSSGEARVLVDAAVLGARWRGWDASSSGHLLAPLDLARRVDGHDVVLPVCTERVEDFLRRRASRAPLTAGEAVTVGVSILRGCADVINVPETTGEWWLDDAGRPLLATDASDRRALEAAASALRSFVVPARVERAWDAAIGAVTRERMTARGLADAEEELFAAAAPEPLSTLTLSPRTALDVGAAGRDGAVFETDPPRSLWSSLVGRVDSDLADTVSIATTALWRRMRVRTSSRKAPWLVGGVVAAAVLAGGALWPAAGGVATVGPATPTAPVEAAADDSPDSGDSPSAPHADPDSAAVETTAGDGDVQSMDLAAVVAALLDERADCNGDTECLAGPLADPTAPLGTGAIDLPAGERTVTLLDDFGDVAVARVDAAEASHPAQLVVIIRRNERWLLRDVRDVAQQP